jgi:hypothetical protein
LISGTNETKIARVWALRAEKDLSTIEDVFSQAHGKTLRRVCQFLWFFSYVFQVDVCSVCDMTVCCVDLGAHPGEP